MNAKIIDILPIEIQNNLYNYLIDINSKNNPPYILEKIMELKTELGSMPLGVVNLSESELAIVDSSGNIYYKINK